MTASAGADQHLHGMKNASFESDALVICPNQEAAADAPARSQSS